MKKRSKRFFAKFLVLVLLLQLFSGFLGFEVKNVSAATDAKSGLTIVNEATVSARVLELANKLGINITSLSQNGDGIYFTKTGTYCANGDHSGCTNCSNVEVIKQKWFTDIFGTISNVNLFPSHYSAYTNGGTISYNARACAGFVGFALWYVVKEDNTSSVYRKYLGDSQIQDFTIENLKKSDIRVGDVIRINVKGKESGIHSMMFISMNESAGTIKVLDCNWKTSADKTAARVRIHDISMSEKSGYSMAITRATNYEPDYGMTYTLPDAVTSFTSAEAKNNIINYAIGLEGYNSAKFVRAGYADIPSGDWCAWFIKLCADRVGIGSLFSSKTSVSDFCTDMIKNYGAKAYYYSDSTFLTSTDKSVLAGATAVTKSSFTPQPGDIYILHESGYSGLSQVGLVIKVVNGSVYAVVGNNGTAQEVQRRESTTNYFYQISNSKCPIVGYIRPDYGSLDNTAGKTQETTVTEETTAAKDTTVQEETTVTKETTVTEATTGWIKDLKNRWIYVDENTGNRVRGWFCSEASKRWYYLDDEEGYMLSDCWFCDSGSNRWYYLGEDGALCTGWITVGDRQYYLDKNGAMCTGWNRLDGAWYLLGSDGAMCTGWQKVGGRYYYLTEQGKCLLNTTTPDGYRVDENGARID